MKANRNQDEIFLAPETGIWLVFAARAVPGHRFDGAPLSAAGLSRLAAWLDRAPRAARPANPLVRMAHRVRTALETLRNR